MTIRPMPAIASLVAHEIEQRQLKLVGLHSRQERLRRQLQSDFDILAGDVGQHLVVALNRLVQVDQPRLSCRPPGQGKVGWKPLIGEVAEITPARRG